MKPDLAYTPDLEKGGFVKIGNINTHYHLAGSGVPVVFVHGSGPGERTALPVSARLRRLAFAPQTGIFID